MGVFFCIEVVLSPQMHLKQFLLLNLHQRVPLIDCQLVEAQGLAIVGPTSHPAAACSRCRMLSEQQLTMDLPHCPQAPTWGLS